ncbi:MAG: acetyl-CoA carboxylase biotin carboxylase subunit [Desulfobacula sp.]|nr:acetyl-CoA carboxylase biotin carboxylase subunit [Desulfobacula sp.]
MFEKILIANRGEIALRVINTCREMGIKTVAVYSDVDKKAAHVIFSDEAIYLGPSEPSLSYLNMDAIIAAAKQTNARAIHPGYGFLSENHEFAQRCRDEGIVFIGPSPKAIKNLGDKITSRKIMEKSGVPITPGLTCCEDDLGVLTNTAKKIGYPVLVKATAGGGGKGIRIVHSSDQIEEAVASASREALKAFGNAEVYLEKFFTKARHIEFQILADQHGNTIHLFERECSIQRRHQKIIEETPSLILTPELRQEMGTAAIKAATASNYENAGTVEFLLDENNHFYFLEINTRLQVEHPITEMTTGVDLVKHQIEIAAGNRLTLKQEDICSRGHAIECRIYAEDPERDFLPCPGKIEFMKEPTGPGIRNDCGVYPGVEVPMEYDPILSKLIVHAETRDQAISKMIKALQDYIILGIKTPIEFMIDAIDSGPFRNAEVFTNFIETHFSNWQANKNLTDMTDLADQPNLTDVDLTDVDLTDVDLTDIAVIAFIADELGGVKNNQQPFSKGKETATPFDTLGNWKL